MKLDERIERSTSAEVFIDSAIAHRWHLLRYAPQEHSGTIFSPHGVYVDFSLENGQLKLDTSRHDGMGMTPQRQERILKLVGYPMYKRHVMPGEERLEKEYSEDHFIPMELAKQWLHEALEGEVPANIAQTIEEHENAESLTGNVFVPRWIDYMKEYDREYDIVAFPGVFRRIGDKIAEKWNRYLHPRSYTPGEERLDYKIGDRGTFYIPSSLNMLKIGSFYFGSTTPDAYTDETTKVNLWEVEGIIETMPIKYDKPNRGFGVVIKKVISKYDPQRVRHPMPGEERLEIETEEMGKIIPERKAFIQGQKEVWSTLFDTMKAIAKERGWSFYTYEGGYSSHPTLYFHAAEQTNSHFEEIYGGYYDPKTYKVGFNHTYGRPMTFNVKGMWTSADAPEERYLIRHDITPANLHEIFSYLKIGRTMPGEERLEQPATVYVLPPDTEYFEDTCYKEPIMIFNSMKGIFTAGEPFIAIGRGPQEITELQNIPKDARWYHSYIGVTGENDSELPRHRFAIAGGNPAADEDLVREVLGTMYEPEHKLISDQQSKDFAPSENDPDRDNFDPDDPDEREDPEELEYAISDPDRPLNPDNPDDFEYILNMTNIEPYTERLTKYKGDYHNYAPRKVPGEERLEDVPERTFYVPTINNTQIREVWYRGYENVEDAKNGISQMIKRFPVFTNENWKIFAVKTREYRQEKTFGMWAYRNGTIICDILKPAHSMPGEERLEFVTPTTIEEIKAYTDRDICPTCGNATKRTILCTGPDSCFDQFKYYEHTSGIPESIYFLDDILYWIIHKHEALQPRHQMPGEERLELVSKSWAMGLEFPCREYIELESPQQSVTELLLETPGLGSANRDGWQMNGQHQWSSRLNQWRPPPQEALPVKPQATALVWTPGQYKPTHPVQKMDKEPPANFPPMKMSDQNAVHMEDDKATNLKLYWPELSDMLVNIKSDHMTVRKKNVWIHNFDTAKRIHIVRNTHNSYGITESDVEYARDKDNNVRFSTSGLVPLFLQSIRTEIDNNAELSKVRDFVQQHFAGKPRHQMPGEERLEFSDFEKLLIDRAIGDIGKQEGLASLFEDTIHERVVHALDKLDDVARLEISGERGKPNMIAKLPPRTGRLDFEEWLKVLSKNTRYSLLYAMDVYSRYSKPLRHSRTPGEERLETAYDNMDKYTWKDRIVLFDDVAAMFVKWQVTGTDLTNLLDDISLATYMTGARKPVTSLDTARRILYGDIDIGRLRSSPEIKQRALSAIDEMLDTNKGTTHRRMPGEERLELMSQAEQPTQLLSTSDHASCITFEHDIFYVPLVLTPFDERLKDNTYVEDAEAEAYDNINDAQVALKSMVSHNNRPLTILKVYGDKYNYRGTVTIRRLLSIMDGDGNIVRNYEKAFMPGEERLETSSEEMAWLNNANISTKLGKLRKEQFSSLYRNLQQKIGPNDPYTVEANFAKGNRYLRVRSSTNHTIATILPSEIPTRYNIGWWGTDPNKLAKQTEYFDSIRSNGYTADEVVSFIEDKLDLHKSPLRKPLPGEERLELEKPTFAQFHDIVKEVANSEEDPNVEELFWTFIPDSAGNLDYIDVPGSLEELAKVLTPDVMLDLKTELAKHHWYDYEIPRHHMPGEERLESEHIDMARKPFAQRKAFIKGQKDMWTALVSEIESLSDAHGWEFVPNPHGLPKSYGDKVLSFTAQSEPCSDAYGAFQERDMPHQVVQQIHAVFDPRDYFIHIRTSEGIPNKYGIIDGHKIASRTTIWDTLHLDRQVQPDNFESIRNAINDLFTSTYKPRKMPGEERLEMSKRKKRKRPPKNDNTDPKSKYPPGMKRQEDWS